MMMTAQYLCPIGRYDDSQQIDFVRNRRSARGSRQLFAINNCCSLISSTLSPAEQSACVWSSASASAAHSRPRASGARCKRMIGLGGRIVRFAYSGEGENNDEFKVHLLPLFLRRAEPSRAEQSRAKASSASRASAAIFLRLLCLAALFSHN